MIVAILYSLVAVILFLFLLRLVKNHPIEYSKFSPEVVLGCMILFSIFWPLFLLYGLWYVGIFLIGRYIG